MDRRDWTLLAIAAAQGEPLSPVQLQKSLFLLGKSFPDRLGEGFYNFEPYLFGPFDKRIYRDADSLAAEGYVAIVQRSGERWRGFAATDPGLEEAAEVARDVGADVLEYLQRVVKWSRRLSFRDLVSSIYAEFPEYRSNSVFNG